MLFHVYKEDMPEGYYSNEPFGLYRAILDADWVMYILLPLLLVIIIVGLMVAWRLHEIPKHRAEHRKLRQAELVSALTLLGLFQHWVWAIALFIAYLDWEQAEETLVRVFRRGRGMPPQTDEPPSRPPTAGEETAPEPASEPPSVVHTIHTPSRYEREERS